MGAPAEAIEPPTVKEVVTESAQTETRKRPRTEMGTAASPERRVEYSPSRSRSQSPRSRGARSPDRETPRSGRDDNVGSIFVGNLPIDITERKLREFFDKYGRILSVKIVFNPETGKSKGFGFVKFDDARDAEDAINEANGKPLDGRALKVNTARYGGYSGRGRGDFHFGRGGFRGDFRGGFRGGRGRGMGRDFRPDFNRNGGYHDRERAYSPPARYSPKDRYSPEPPEELEKRRSVRSPSPARRDAERSPRGVAKRDASPSSSSGASDSDSKRSDRVLDGPPTTGDIKRRRQMNGTATSAEETALKKEVEALRRNEEELTTRLAAVEAELASTRSSKTDSVVQVAELKRSVQRNEEAAAQFKKWLKALSDHSRNLLGAKAALVAAETTLKGYEEDLSLFLEEADTFLLSDKPRKKRRHLKTEEATPAIEDVHMEVEAEGDHQGGEPAVDGNPAAEALDVAANFKPGIKFKIAAS